MHFSKQEKSLIRDILAEVPVYQFTSIPMLQAKFEHKYTKTFIKSTAYRLRKIYLFAGWFNADAELTQKWNEFRRNLHGPDLIAQYYATGLDPVLLVRLRKDIA